MIIECVNRNNIFEGQAQSLTPKLKIGDRFVVLELYLDALYFCHSMYTIIVGEEYARGPTLFESRYFKVLSPKLSSRWNYAYNEFYLKKISLVDDKPMFKRQAITISPKSWQADDEYWDKYFDNDKKSVEAFNYEAKLMHEEENFPFVKAFY